MQYYVIYSAGGGAGDRNGVKRVWNGLPESIKGHILLKFGDLYFNHASSANLVKQNIWNSINNIKNWFLGGVNDNGQTNCNILLDSGTSKIVAYVQKQFGHLSNEEQISKFIEIIKNNRIVEKYASVVNESQVDNAVTFDIPNLFKIRTNIETGRITNVFTRDDYELIIQETAEMCNNLNNLLGADNDVLLTTINANRTDQEILDFIELLNYTPNGYAIGGLTALTVDDFRTRINELNSLLDLSRQPRVHFLGAGGLTNGRILKNIFHGESFSADVSTPFNRAIDGNTSGTTQSGYYDYDTTDLIRIKRENKESILSKHRRVQNPLFNSTEMENIIDKIILHQSGNSSTETYDARAKLYFHNSDVYKRNIIS